MFWRKEPTLNPYTLQIMNNTKISISGKGLPTPCATELIPMLETFERKSINSKISSEDLFRYNNLLKLSKITTYIAANTRNYEKLSNDDVEFLRKLFDEVESLRKQVIKNNSHKTPAEDLRNKIDCISEILLKNSIGMHDSIDNHIDWRDGMIFRSYKNLWKIIHRINNEWTDLCSRGFSLKVFYDYWSSFKYQRRNKEEFSEERKIDDFLDLLDGTKRFVTIYEHKAVSFAVVSNDSQSFNRIIATQFDHPYGLRAKGEKNI